MSCSTEPEKSYRGTKVEFKDVPEDKMFDLWYAQNAAHRYRKVTPNNKDGRKYNAILQHESRHPVANPNYDWIEEYRIVYIDPPH